MTYEEFCNSRITYHWHHITSGQTGTVTKRIRDIPEVTYACITSVEELIAYLNTTMPGVFEFWLQGK